MQLTRGMTALITGASSGIGEAFSQALAARGINLVLVARSQDRLEATATELSHKHQIRAEAIAADLTHPEAAAQIASVVAERGLAIDILINNAGFATHGYFEAIDSDRDNAQVQVDVAAVVAMTHTFAPAMLARKRGAIINVASTAAFQPVPYMAVYGASKAFVLSFSQALAAEFQSQGVSVLALCPGATETAFFTIAGEDAAVGRKRTTTQVVATALRALESGRRVIVDGWSNAAVAQLTRFMPRRMSTQIAGAIERPRDAQR